MFKHYKAVAIDTHTFPVNWAGTWSTSWGFLLIPYEGLRKLRDYATHGYSITNICPQMLELAKKLDFDTECERQCTMFHDEYYQLSDIVGVARSVDGLALKCPSIGHVHSTCLQPLYEYMLAHGIMRAECEDNTYTRDYIEKLISLNSKMGVS